MEALVVDDTGFPKDGDASPCVARQYSGTLGKTANCQIGVSVHLVNEHASCAADWRLFCPESWDDTALDDPVAAAGARRRRERAGIPGEVRHREKWRLALDMIEEMTGPGGWGVLEQITAAGGPRPVVAADIGYGDNALFRQQLTAAGWQYVVAVKGSTSAYARRRRPAGQALRRARPAAQARLPAPAGDLAPARDRRRGPGPAGDLAAGHQDQQGQPRRRHDQLLPGDPGPARQPPHPPRGRPAACPACWLLAEWPPEADEPTDYWLSTLPEDTPIDELVRLAKIRWRVEHDYRELKTGLGLDHFEGRSFTGWHRHVTLAALAQAFCTMLRTDPKAPAPG